MNYRFAAKQKTLALGAYPEVSLAEARQARDAARATLRDNQDPAQVKREVKTAQRRAAANSFEIVSEAYLDKRRAEGLAKNTLLRDTDMIAKARRAFGSRPTTDIGPQEILAVARQIESRGLPAQRFRSTMGRVFRYAIAEGLADRNPAADISDALIKRPTNHYPSPKDPVAIGALMRAIRGYDGTAVTRAALKIGVLTFVRPGELRHAEWSEFDIKAALWRIPAAKMKMKLDHIVPLSRQAVAEIEELRGWTGDEKYLFPSILKNHPRKNGSRPMSDGTVNAALRRLGYMSDVLVGHGFRSMASTTLNESLRFQPDWVERQLAHVELNDVRAAYNAAEYLPARKKMMQWYADWLDAQHDLAVILS